MKKAIAIAIAKAREAESKRSASPPERPGEIEEEISRLGLGILIFFSAGLGVVALVTLFFGLISEGGPLRQLMHWMGLTIAG